jgi:hypothetical protein
MSTSLGIDVTREEQGSQLQELVAREGVRLSPSSVFLHLEFEPSFLGCACEGGRDACALVRGKRARSVSSAQEGCLDLGPGIAEEHIVD